jgi:hypothetical protein
MPAPKPESRVRQLARDGAHLAVLSALAFAQPIFDILGKNPAFFAVRGSSSGEIVLFALALTLLPPAGLLVIEAAVGLASRTAARIVHLVFVGGLTALIFLQISTKSDLLSGVGALVFAAVLGAAGAALYWRASPVRTFLTFLVPAPLVFLALFLLSSPVHKLVFPENAQAKTVAVKSKTPVVVIVFDELSTASLMDRNGHVDARRWPSFAALAHDSTWFRSATTVHPHTEEAVPAILDGKLPNLKLLPVFADHPQNIFTFLGRSYQLRVIEALTHLCPPSLCKKTKNEKFDPNENDQTGSLPSDVGIVYLHLLLPNPYAADLPPIANTWGNFGGKEKTDKDSTKSNGKPTKTVPACGRNICRFASLLSPDRKPTFYYLHAILPHVPWLYLPSGKRYSGDVRVIPGTENGFWTDDRWLTTQAQQRYLLQVGYADKALGILLHRLRSTGIYDRALVILTGDEGETFLPGGPRRNVTQTNLADVEFVPLFVKLPGQKHGRIDDSYATNMDVFPTVAHVLKAPIPWHVDGQSLVGTKLQAEATVSVLAGNGRPISAPLSKLRADRARELQQQWAVFGTGPLDQVYRIGPHPDLLGRIAAELSVRPSPSTGVSLNGRELLGNVDLSTDLLPSYVTGNITGSHPKQQDLAVAVNGTIRAMTRSYTELGATKFAALVPEDAFTQGENDVTVYSVGGTAVRPALEELRGSELTYTLSGSTIKASDGKTIQVQPGALTGEVRALANPGGSNLGGWAADLKAHRAADSIIVFVDGRSAFAGRNGNYRRKDIVDRYGVDNAGFIFQLPAGLLPAAGQDHQVRVFALAGGVASELRYLAGYPWATGG